MKRHKNGQLYLNHVRVGARCTFRYFTRITKNLMSHSFRIIGVMKDCLF